MQFLLHMYSNLSLLISEFNPVYFSLKGATSPSAGVLENYIYGKRFLRGVMSVLKIWLLSRPK